MENINGLTSGTQKIVNQYAYENSEALAQESMQMFGQLITHTSERQADNEKIASDITKYISDLGSAADPNIIRSDIYMNIYPDFVRGYEISLQSIPEFPFPVLIVTAMITSVIIISRRF